MPSQKTINPAARVRSYPVAEQHRFVWVWTGDPALADPDLIPDLHWNDDPDWTGDGKLIHVDCDYKLVVDNLMDLTTRPSCTARHRPARDHRGAIRGYPRDELADGHPLDDRRRPAALLVDAAMKPEEPPGKVDRWQIIHFQAPSTIAIDVGVAPTGTGAPGRRPSQGVNGYRAQHDDTRDREDLPLLLGLRAELQARDQRYTTIIREGVTGVFGEDEVVLAAQQKGVDEHPDKQFYNLNIDGGAMWARRLIDQMIAEEGSDDALPESAREAEEEAGTSTRVEATEADAERLGVR